MAESKWRPGKRDLLFIGVVAGVILLLVLGSSDRTTKPVPSDEVHRSATSRTACVSCHDSKTGIMPMPKTHMHNDQCFQCHKQPKGWKGAQ